MQEYFFLWGLAFVWICFAVVQDLRTREISNWLNFSLLGLALLYRGFYALSTGNGQFFWFGLLGAGFFMALAYLFYYGRAFAGGDAKLLMALGAVVPFEQINDYLTIGLGFVFALFLLGSLYSLVYTFFLVVKRWPAFSVAFMRQINKHRKFSFSCIIIGFVLFLIFWFIEPVYASIIGVALVILPILYAYARSIEKACMIKLVNANRLTEGDWLERGVRVGGKVIVRSVHGLSLKDISLLQKAKMKVWIKEGIPFSPAFLLAFLAMVFYVLR